MQFLEILIPDLLKRLIIGEVNPKVQVSNDELVVVMLNQEVLILLGLVKGFGVDLSDIVFTGSDLILATCKVTV